MWKQILALNVLNASFPLLIQYYDKKYREEDIKLAFPDNPPTLNLPVKETFDFVIVGGGTAGLLLARRLSEVYSVVVLEAGGNAVPQESSVYVGTMLYEAPIINYLYSSTPQKYVGKNGSGAILKTSSGKMLGGSSSHNEGHYERGSPHDYDRWAKVTGDPSWRWENVLKYFLKHEDYHGQFPSNGQHRTGGLLPVTKSEKGTRDGLWESVARDLGYEFRDSKGPLNLGFSPAEYNINLTNGQRVSSYTAFVQPIENKRENLVIRRYSVASEIIFDGKRAIGVAYERHKVPSVVFAAKEVIICAGGLRSPILLIKSGIGPQDELKRAKIPPVKILPVGFNLQDHASIYTPPINVTDKSAIKTDFYKLQFKDFNTFVETGKGPLTTYGQTEAFQQSRRAKKEKDDPDWPDIQFYLGNIANDDALFCLTNLLRPRSRGRVYYNSSATTLEDSLQPIFDYNYFSDPTDINPLIEGIQFCRKIVNTPTLRKVGARYEPFSKLAPQCKKTSPVGSRKFWKCYIRAVAISDNHEVGTVRMGKPDDPRSVLDSKLRVLGVKGLRVCDGSIMPFITSANVGGPIMMIAEKTSDEILKEWSSK